MTPCARGPAFGLVLLTLLASAAGAAAQTPPATQSTDDPPSMIDRLKEPDQGGGLHLTEHFAVVFGGIKQGSGIALGPAVSTKFKDGSYVQLKGVYSVKNFKLLQLRYDSRRFWTDRAIVISRLRWQDAPELALYQIGQLSPNARVDYGEEKTEGSSRIVVKATPNVSVSTGFGIERFITTGGRLEAQEGPQGLPDVPAVPGLGTRPWYAHTFGAIAYDTRLSPDYSRSGRFFEAIGRDFHDVKGGQDSFRRFEGTAEQLIPMYEGRGVATVSLQTWLSFSEHPEAVPLFVMPALGGGNLLRAFPSYRFRDRDALLFSAEYRWAVHPMADVAATYEAGKVGPTVKNLGFRDMAHSIAIGIRAHTEKAALFRADIAHGREGFGFRIGFSAGGS